MKKVSIIIAIMYFLLVGTVASVFAIPPKNHRTYDCKMVGVQKIKPYHMKKIRHFGYITLVKLGFRHKA